jgi:hypothetical protein
MSSPHFVPMSEANFCFDFSIEERERTVKKRNFAKTNLENFCDIQRKSKNWSFTGFWIEFH